MVPPGARFVVSTQPCGDAGKDRRCLRHGGVEVYRPNVADGMPAAQGLGAESRREILARLPAARVEEVAVGVPAMVNPPADIGGKRRVDPLQPRLVAGK